MFDGKKRDRKLKGRICVKIWDYVNKYDCKMFYNSFGIMYLSTQTFIAKSLVSPVLLQPSVRSKYSAKALPTVDGDQIGNSRHFTSMTW